MSTWYAPASTADCVGSSKSRAHGGPSYIAQAQGSLHDRISHSKKQAWYVRYGCSPGGILHCCVQGHPVWRLVRDLALASGTETAAQPPSASEPSSSVRPIQRNRKRVEAGAVPFSRGFLRSTSISVSTSTHAWQGVCAVNMWVDRHMYRRRYLGCNLSAISSECPDGDTICISPNCLAKGQADVRRAHLPALRGCPCIQRLAAHALWQKHAAQFFPQVWTQRSRRSLSSRSFFFFLQPHVDIDFYRPVYVIFLLSYAKEFGLPGPS